MIRSFTYWFAAVILLSAFSAGASVADSSQYGFTVKHVQVLKADPRVVFDKFTSDINKWWHPDHTWSGKAENLYIQVYIGGVFGEKWESGSVRHMNVIYLEPGKVLRMEGGLGPMQQHAVTGVLTLEIAADTSGTKVAMTYTAGGYMPGGMAKLAPLVDQVLGLQFSRFAAWVNEGKL